MLAPSSALAVVDNYTECKTIMGFVVELEQTDYAVPAGSEFTIVHSHAPTEAQFSEQYIAYESQLLRKVELEVEPGEQTVPMVLVDVIYNFPYPQGANSVAVYDMTVREFHTSDDLMRDGLFSVPLNCYPVSGLY
ncbi:hypothetical protein DS901_07100 [Loktanella sp. D2R18]|uniref:hypothetical protein n=2 Tax=Rhodobacterales TaxID=204455 RepID=UPI000DE908CB|nr:hypothetical protein [Loktanella sp. D2R18]RBW44179.1 hypothetical protein DS901_07100 [Loktanella sp. D2R18]